MDKELLAVIGYHDCGYHVKHTGLDNIDVERLDRVLNVIEAKGGAWYGYNVGLLRYQDKLTHEDLMWFDDFCPKTQEDVSVGTILYVRRYSLISEKKLFDNEVLVKKNELDIHYARKEVLEELDDNLLKSKETLLKLGYTEDAAEMIISPTKAIVESQIFDVVRKIEQLEKD